MVGRYLAYWSSIDEPQQTNVFWLGRKVPFRCAGRCDEWYLHVPNSIGHLAFGFVSRLDEDSISLGMPFSSSRFVTIRSVSNSVDDDGIKQLFVEALPERGVALSLHGDHRLKGFQCLDRAFEADRARLNAVLRCRLGNDCADEVIGQNVCPDLLTHQLGRSAAQDVHLQSLL